MDADGGGAAGRIGSRALVLGGGIPVLLVSLGLLVLVRPGVPGIPPSPEAEEIQRLRRETRALELELELASTPAHYLVLDVPGRALTLKASGVVLRPFVLLSAETRGGDREPRLAGGIHPMDTVWQGGALLPEPTRKRRVILSDSVDPPDPSGAVAFIPPTPEEETPAPPAFRIRFQDGFSILVRVEGRGRFERMGNWFHLAPWRRDELRLEVVMSPEEAGALYRAFAPGTQVLATGAALAGRDGGPHDPGSPEAESGRTP